MKKNTNELAAARKAFSTVGLGCVAIMVITFAVRAVIKYLFPGLESTSWWLWIYTFGPMYVIAVPLSLLVFRMTPAHSGVYGSKSAKSLTPGQIVRAVFIALFLLKVGSYVGSLVNNILDSLLGMSSASSITTLSMSDAVLLKFLFMAIVGPLMEELIFRKLVIDRVGCYGGKTAVVVSALMFGLFHGNLTQFFYAFAVGLLFGYIYLKTGRLRYSAGLHIMINSSQVIEATVLGGMTDVLTDIDAMSSSQLLLAVVWMAATLALLIIGLVLFCRSLRKVSYEKAPQELPKGTVLRTVFLNVGMALFVIACAYMIVRSMV